MNPFQQGPIRLYPVTQSCLADTETPLSVYSKLATDVPGSYLFESVVGGEKWARYSIVGLTGRNQIMLKQNQLSYYLDQQLIESQYLDDPLEHIKRYQQRFRVKKLSNLPIFNGGLVGFWGYEVIRYIEQKMGQKPLKPDLLDLPDCVLVISTELVVVDNLNGMLHFICYSSDESPISQQQAYDTIDGWIEKLQSSNPLCIHHKGFEQKPTKITLRYDFGESKYKAAVSKIKQHIKQGDLMQAVPSHRMSCDFKHPPINLYRALRHINPSPYMYFINFVDFQIIGSSPEILARLENDQVVVRPIAGTRARGKTEWQDQQFEQELLNDSKELAEHLMLIDLGRNDIGRICRTGSVKVTDQMVIERYSHVMHIVSNVVGEVLANTHPIDVIKATFPAGTLSGAPKIRAMEIIDEIEPHQRNFYAGAVGYIGWHNNMDLAIAIRTAVIKNQTVYIQAGGGIVADSQEQDEWQETLNKANALKQAIEFVNNGMRSPCSLAQ